MNRRDFLKLTGGTIISFSVLSKLFASDPITDEFSRCRKDPVYFINHYVKIRTPEGNIVPLKLRPNQERAVRVWHAGGDANFMKDRQVGATTIALAYALWLIMFHEDANVLVVSASHACSHHAATIFKTMQYNLPAVMQHKTVSVEYRLKTALRNGSSIKFCSHRELRTMCSTSYHTVFLDEPAWFDHPREVNDFVRHTAKNTASYSSPGSHNWGIYRTNVPNKAGYIQESAS